MAVTEASPTDSGVAPHPEEKVNRDRELLVDAQRRGFFPTLGAYFKLSGPGWLQSAITLGGGSLGSSLYLGVLAGASMLWVQPAAMILGVIMLSAIAYVTTTTEQRPFGQINRYVNPVLGWSWALASLAANMVWSMPQYALATAVIEKNLLPASVTEFQGDGAGPLTYGLCAAIFFGSLMICWMYERGGIWIKIYEWILKVMVLGIVACFVGVVVALRAEIDWGAVGAGFLPDPTQLFRPASSFDGILAAIGDQAGSIAGGIDPDGRMAYWRNAIVEEQRGVIISAAATAVGINMTFMFPYSMLAKRWTKEFRGLAVFDLATGMVIPFTIATSCVMLAAASQYHPKPGVVELQPKDEWKVDDERLYRLDLLRMTDPDRAAVLAKTNVKALDDAGKAEFYDQLPPLTPSEQKLAWHLKRRQAQDLAKSLSPLVGDDVANVVFGLGVLGMTLSTIIMLMLISGFVICELLGVPPRGWPHRLGCMAAATGILGPIVFASEARFYLVVPTSVFGFMLLPIAYLTFMALMNNRSVLGKEMPTGGKRLVWNALMLVSTTVAAAGSLWSIWTTKVYGREIGPWSLAIFGAFFLLALVVHFARKRPSEPAQA